MIHLLHISDLHFVTGAHWNNMKYAILNEVKNRLSSVPPDKKLLVITGDLHNFKTNNYSDAKNFINELVSNMGISMVEDVFIIPGNHDASDRKSPFLASTISSIKQDINKLNNLSKEDSFELLKPFVSYMNLVKDLGIYNADTDNFPATAHVKTWRNKLNILHLNTCLVADGTTKDNQIIDITAATSDGIREKMNRNGLPVIALGHNQFFDLHESQQDSLTALFYQQKVSVYLCGDKHKPGLQRTHQNIHLRQNTHSSESEFIPNIVCYKSVADDTDNYSDFGMIWHVWDEQDDKVTMEYREWVSSDQAALQSDYKLNGSYNIRRDKPSVPPKSNYSMSDVNTFERLPEFLANKAAAKIVTIANPMRPSDFFRGRDDIIRTIETGLKNKDKLVLLNGMGGIGKTEICRSLFWKYAKTSLPGVENLGWLNFNENLQTTFWRQFNEIEDIDNTEEYLIKARNYIKQLGSKLMLFIDNANSISVNDSKFLLGLECRVILTSRSAIDRTIPIEVGKLEMQDCLELYRKHSKDNYSPNRIIESIIKLADNHTLAVELLAKTQRASGKSAQEIISILEKNGFNLSEPVAYQQHEDVFIEHMSKIFDISGLDNEENQEELHVLQLFSLLATEPLKKSHLQEWFALSDLRKVNNLVRKGWLTEGISGNAFISMHPVISSLIRHKKMLDCETAKPLVTAITKTLSMDSTDIFMYKIPFLIHAVSIAGFYNEEDGFYANLLHNIAGVYSGQGEYPKALEWFQKALVIRKKVLGKEHPDTATTYNDIAAVYSSQGEYPKVLAPSQHAPPQPE